MEDIQDLIERYLMGQLSLHELALVEKKIKLDETFADEVNLQRDILIGINEYGKQQIRHKLTDFSQEPKIFRIISVNKPVIVRYAVAASIILAITISILYPKISNSLIEESKKSHISIAQ
jgi:hypothetical protein